MSNVLEYKGYTGTVEFSADDQVFFGKVAGIRDVVTFEGKSVAEINRSFKEAVDDYIESCKALGKDPDTAFKGSFNVRIKPRIHRLITERAQHSKITLNRYVESILEKEVLGESDEEFIPGQHAVVEDAPSKYRRRKTAKSRKQK